jgi:hypothetical protein
MKEIIFEAGVAQVEGGILGHETIDFLYHGDAETLR